MVVTEIIPVEENGISIPYFETAVAAGDPAYVSEFFTSSINISEELVKNKKATFCVRVNGQSMIDAGINDGDLLIVDKELSPENKSIILAVIDGEYTVKRLIVKDAELYLQPENEAFSPIKVTRFMDFRIWGVVTGVIRKFR